jgi:hypothetical protein
MKGKPPSPAKWRFKKIVSHKNTTLGDDKHLSLEFELVSTLFTVKCCDSTLSFSQLHSDTQFHRNLFNIMSSFESHMTFSMSKSTAKTSVLFKGPTISAPTFLHLFLTPIETHRDREKNLTLTIPRHSIPGKRRQYLTMRFHFNKDVEGDILVSKEADKLYFT